MAVRDEPTVRHWPVLPNDDGDVFGQFVVIALDRAQSLAPLGDPLVLEEALKLPNDRYLAIAFGTAAINHFAENGDFKLNCEFYLVRQGLSKEVATECIPIAPANGHPANREPVSSTAPLPWDDLYVLTVHSFYAVVSRIHFGPTPSPARLTKDMRWNILCARDEDLEASEPPPKPAPPGTAPFPIPKPPSLNPEGSSDGESVFLSETESTPSQPDPKEAALQVIERKALMVEKYVELWVDLEQACPNLDDPEDLLPVLNKIFHISEDWRTRSIAELLGKRPETDAWLQGVGDAFDVDLPPFKPADGCEEGLDDAALGPEDAADEDDTTAAAAKTSDVSIREGAEAASRPSASWGHVSDSSLGDP